MEGYQSNAENLMDYLSLIEALVQARETQEVGTEDFCTLWEKIQEKEAVSPPEAGLNLPVLRGAFGLSPNTFFLVMVAVLFELDASFRLRYLRTYGTPVPDLQYGYLLAERLYPIDCTILEEREPAFSRLLLCAWRREGALLARPLLLNRAVLEFLSCGRVSEEPWSHFYFPGSESFLPVQQKALASLTRWMQDGNSPLLLDGLTGCGKHTLLKRAADSTGRTLVFADGETLSVFDEAKLDDAVRDLAATALLRNGVLCVEFGQRRTSERIWLVCHAFAIPFVWLPGEAGEGTEGERQMIPRFLSPENSVTAWRWFAQEAGAFCYEPEKMAARYRYPIGKIRAATLQAAVLARDAGKTAAEECDLLDAVRLLNQSPDYGLLYDPPYGELVVDAQVERQLTLFCTMARERARLEQAGFPMKRSVNAVFHGPSGTGKTMAASEVARRLGMPLLRADLSQVMDKYIGETEKHLERLFLCAEENNCVLFFDEADVLFSKRTNVSSSHDRYANVSTSFLLQRLEQYDGVVILSTNLLENFDGAFLRRIQYTVKFTMPCAALRERLWCEALPKDSAEGLNFALLAQAELSPARIREAALAAGVCAFLEGRERVVMKDALLALKLEMEKNGTFLPPAVQAEFVRGEGEGTLPNGF